MSHDDLQRSLDAFARSSRELELAIGSGDLAAIDRHVETRAHWIEALRARRNELGPRERALVTHLLAENRSAVRELEAMRKHAVDELDRVRRARSAARSNLSAPSGQRFVSQRC